MARVGARVRVPTLNSNLNHTPVTNCNTLIIISLIIASVLQRTKRSLGSQQTEILLKFGSEWSSTISVGSTLFSILDINM